MSLDRLTVQGLRNLTAFDLKPGPGVNWFFGVNGAGKTSVLEAIHVLARGRSFRTANVPGVIQHGAESLSVVVHRADSGAMLGVERRPDGWRGRIDGRDSRRISEFALRLPLVLIEPDSHRLIDGGPDRRRQYLDWLLFHVEHSYLKTWQRFARLLKQRNAGLKSGADNRTLDAIEAEFVSAAQVINALRHRQVAALSGTLKALCQDLAFTLPGPVELTYRPGHAADKQLSELIGEYRDRDRERGFTRHGPHRADLALTCGGHPAAIEMSRGQQKLLAILLQLAHLQMLSEHADCAPILLVDDPVSELDERHLGILLDWLEAAEVQSWVTATIPGRPGMAMFHVEQGVVQAMVQ